MTDTDLLIAGAGPAGLAAAITAGQLGLRAILVDENAQAGGQYYRQTPLRLGATQKPAGQMRRGAERIARASDVARVRLQASVWGLDDRKRVWIQSAAGSEVLNPRGVVLATGSYDRPIAFPGWTLPGVLTAGGAQALAKGQIVRPGTRAVVAGTGPISLVVAAQLDLVGVKVVELVEASTVPRLALLGPRALPYPSRWRDLPGLLRELARAGVVLTFGSIIRSAHGAERVERACVVRVGRDGRPDESTARLLDVDLVCVGYGFVASTELARIAGCALRWDPGHSQLVPRHDGWQETSVPGIFVAGEATGLGGAEMAEAQGTLAAIGVARRLGRLTERRADALAQPIRRRLRYWKGFASLLAQGFPIPAATSWLVHDDTLVCRCENITYGQVRDIVDAGARVLNDLKMGTRCGMGLCQGRICGALLPPLLADQTDGRFDRTSMFTARPPVGPVSVSGLAST